MEVRAAARGDLTPRATEGDACRRSSDWEQGSGWDPPGNYVNQSVTVVVDAGAPMAVTYTHVDSGEASILIFGSVGYTAANTC